MLPVSYPFDNPEGGGMVPKRRIPFNPVFPRSRFTFTGTRDSGGEKGRRENFAVKNFYNEIFRAALFNHRQPVSDKGWMGVEDLG